MGNKLQGKNRKMWICSAKRRLLTRLREEYLQSKIVYSKRRERERVLYVVGKVTAIVVRKLVYILIKYIFIYRIRQGNLTVSKFVLIQKSSNFFTGPRIYLYVIG
jgi:hypothetical protein